MTHALHYSRNSPKTSAIVIWWAMSLGPIIFCLSLVSIGVWLFGVDHGWWGDSQDPPSDLMLFGPIVAVTLAELFGVIVASSKRRELAGTAFDSHPAAAIQTFWIMAGGFVGSNVLVMLLLLAPNMNAVGMGVAGFFIMAAVIPLLFIWKSWRVIRSLRRARASEPWRIS